jgi:hypothetical protein
MVEFRLINIAHLPKCIFGLELEAALKSVSKERAIRAACDQADDAAREITPYVWCIPSGSLEKTTMAARSDVYRASYGNRAGSNSGLIFFAEELDIILET